MVEALQILLMRELMMVTRKHDEYLADMAQHGGGRAQPRIIDHYVGGVVFFCGFGASCSGGRNHKSGSDEYIARFVY